MDDENIQQNPSLPEGEAKNRIMGLFKRLDVAGKGEIPLLELSMVKSQNGTVGKLMLGDFQDMDYNGDQHIDAGEWEIYFAHVQQTCGTPAALSSILDELTEAIENKETIANCVAMSDLGAPVAMSQEDLDEYMESGKAQLSEPRKISVTQLFKTWDFNGDGVIQIAKMSTTGIEIGPRITNVFDQFATMDTNADGVVSLDEMLAYFAQVEKLYVTNPSHLDDLIAEMTDAATSENGVTEMLELARALTMSVADEAPPPLAEEWDAKVTKVFNDFGEDPIPANVLNEVKLDFGPTISVGLPGIETMDVNGDGKVELSEMKHYFQIAALNDQSFTAVLDALSHAAQIRSAVMMSGQ